eukprot:g2767.t1
MVWKSFLVLSFFFVVAVPVDYRNEDMLISSVTNQCIPGDIEGCLQHFTEYCDRHDFGMALGSEKIRIFADAVRLQAARYKNLAVLEISGHCGDGTLAMYNELKRGQSLISLEENGVWHAAALKLVQHVITPSNAAPHISLLHGNYMKEFSALASKWSDMGFGVIVIDSNESTYRDIVIRLMELGLVHTDAIVIADNMYNAKWMRNFMEEEMGFATDVVPVTKPYRDGVLIARRRKVRIGLGNESCGVGEICEVDSVDELQKFALDALETAEYPAAAFMSVAKLGIAYLDNNRLFDAHGALRLAEHLGSATRNDGIIYNSSNLWNKVQTSLRTASKRLLEVSFQHTKSELPWCLPAEKRRFSFAKISCDKCLTKVKKSKKVKQHEACKICISKGHECRCQCPSSWSRPLTERYSVNAFLNRDYGKEDFYLENCVGACKEEHISSVNVGKNHGRISESWARSWSDSYLKIRSQLSTDFLRFNKGGVKLHELPKKMFRKFLEYGERYSSTGHCYFQEGSSDGGTVTLFWSAAMLRGVVLQTQLGMYSHEEWSGGVWRNYYSYPNHAIDFFRAFSIFPIVNKRVLVAGSQSPWLEGMSLAFGASSVTTSEWVNVKNLSQGYSHVNTVKAPEGLVDEIKKNGLFDAVLSFSSVEHDGLGRYGDPINPRGDFHALAEFRHLIRPGGKLFLAIPVEGTDGGMICNNLHRIYGRKRFEALTSEENGWRLLETIGGHMPTFGTIWNDPSKFKSCEGSIACDWQNQPLFVFERVIGEGENEYEDFVDGSAHTHNIKPQIDPKNAFWHSNYADLTIDHIATARDFLEKQKQNISNDNGTLLLRAALHAQAAIRIHTGISSLTSILHTSENLEEKQTRQDKKSISVVELAIAYSLQGEAFTAIGKELIERVRVCKKTESNPSHRCCACRNYDGDNIFDGMEGSNETNHLVFFAVAQDGYKKAQELVNSFLLVVEEEEENNDDEVALENAMNLLESIESGLIELAKLVSPILLQAKRISRGRRDVITLQNFKKNFDATEILNAFEELTHVRVDTGIVDNPSIPITMVHVGDKLQPFFGAGQFLSGLEDCGCDS